MSEANFCYMNILFYSTTKHHLYKLTNTTVRKFVFLIYRCIVCRKTLSCTFVPGNEMKIVYTTSINSRTKFEQN